MSNEKFLPPDHAKRIWQELRPGLSYLSRLRARMVAIGFLPDDPLMLMVVKAQESVQDLAIRLHYLGCDGGVG